MALMTGVMQGVLMNRATVLVMASGAGEWMLVGAHLAAMDLMMPMMPMMGRPATFAAHHRSRAAGNMPAALGARVRFVQDLLVALGLIARTAKLKMLLVGLVMVRMVLNGGIFLDRATMLPVMEALMTLHVFFSC